MRESTLEHQVKLEVERLGGLCLKLGAHSCAGLPDRLCVMPGGVVLFVEVKRPGRENQLYGGRSPIQVEMQNQLIDRDAIVLNIGSPAGLQMIESTWAGLIDQKEKMED